MGPIGVLSLQGDFREHLATLEALSVATVRVRKPSDLEGISGLIIPGGESTVIDKLSKIYNLREPIQKLITKGLPVFGTCAGLIMLANKLEDATATQETFGGLDVVVQRNAFGSQANSFEIELHFEGISEPVAAAFIRAPIVLKVGPNVQTLASLPNGEIVAVRQGNLLGISFHPEVCDETAVHVFFVEMCKTANFVASN
ncbi:MAG: pyridoxal 5'-phosphate synthase glutaminase subunit PdxT [Actinomycetes bacterium]